jgi:fructosamine-3-kinase
MVNDWINHLPLEDIRQVTHVGGGDVNQAYRIDTGKEIYFLLVQPNHSQNFYTSEIAGLKAFNEAGILDPRVITSGQMNGNAHLLFHSGKNNPRFMENRGHSECLNNSTIYLTKNLSTSLKFLTVCCNHVFIP